MKTHAGQAGSDDVDLADRLHSAAIHLLRRLRAEDPASGLSAPRLSALSVVVHAGRITPKRLAAAEQVRPPTISRMIRDLEGLGLVRRQGDPDDDRVQWISATPRGRRLLQRGRQRRVARLAADVAQLPARQRKLLDGAAELLEQLSRSVESPDRSQ